MREISSRVYLPELYQSDAALPLFIRESRFLEFLGQSVLNIKYKLDLSGLPSVYQIPIDMYVYKSQYTKQDSVDRQWQKGWANTLSYIVEARDLAERSGAGFLLVSFSDAWRLDSRSMRALYDTYPAMRQLDLDFDKPEERLGVFSRESGLAYLDLLPALF
jgi:hypothetical protein